MLRIFLIFAFFLVSGKHAIAKEPQKYIHLIANSEVKDDAFLGTLKCMLENIYTMQVIIHYPHALDYTQSFRNERGQYRAEDLLRFLESQQDLRALSANGPLFYFITSDMFDKRYRGGNFLLGLMRENTNMMVMSLARLRHEEDRITSDRVFRLAAKNTAKFHGHEPSGKCFMGFSNSVSELDNRPIKLCEPDLNALKAMGLLRPEIKDGTILKGCMIISKL